MNDVRKFLDIAGTKLCVFVLNGQDCFESYELSTLLGYQQPSSLRKQVLTNWSNEFVQGTDFLLLHDQQTLSSYQKLFRQVHGNDFSISLSRGCMFFTTTGLYKVLEKTSKSTQTVTDVLDAAGYSKASRAKEEISFESPSPVRSKEDRLFEYQIMQTLIGQLERIRDPALRNLSICAAENALGRRLNELRTGEALSVIFTQTAPKSPQVILTSPRTPISGPLFVREDYYSMTRIGVMAGGYSAKQAGLAADIVAEELGYTREQIRNEKLPINEISMRPDTTTGAKRPMVRFHKDFANKVVQELRSNSAFEIEPPNITAFDSGDKPYPRLNRGPLDDSAPTEVLSSVSRLPFDQ